MEYKIKLAGKYDIKDHELIRADKKTVLKAEINYSEQMGVVYFRFENAESYVITKAVDVEPHFGYSLSRAWYYFCNEILTALTEATWEEECPFCEQDKKNLEESIEEFAEPIFRMRALEELESIF